MGSSKELLFPASGFPQEGRGIVPKMLFNVDGNATGGGSGKRRRRGAPQGLKRGENVPLQGIGDDGHDAALPVVTVSLTGGDADLPSARSDMEIQLEPSGVRFRRFPQDRRPSREAFRREMAALDAEDAEEAEDGTVVIGSDHPWGEIHLDDIPTVLVAPSEDPLATAITESSIPESILAMFDDPARREQFVRQRALLNTLIAIYDSPSPLDRPRLRSKKFDEGDPVHEALLELEISDSRDIPSLDDIVATITTYEPTVRTAAHDAAVSAVTRRQALVGQSERIAAHAELVVGPETIDSLDNDSFVDSAQQVIGFLGNMTESLPDIELFSANSELLGVEESVRKLHARTLARQTQHNLVERETELRGSATAARKILDLFSIQEQLTEAGSAHPDLVDLHRSSEEIDSDNGDIQALQVSVREILGNGSSLFERLRAAALQRARVVIKEHVKTFRELRKQVDNAERWESGEARISAEKSISDQVRALRRYFADYVGFDADVRSAELNKMAEIKVPRELRLAARAARRATAPDPVAMEGSFELAYAASRDILTSRETTAKAISTRAFTHDTPEFFARVHQAFPDNYYPNNQYVLGPVGGALIAAIGSEALTPRNVDQLETVIDSFVRAANGETVQNIIGLDQRNAGATMNMRTRLHGIRSLEDEVDRLSTIITDYSIRQELITVMTGTEASTEERLAMEVRLTDRLNWLKEFLAVKTIEGFYPLTPGEREGARQTLLFLRSIRPTGDNE